MMPEKKTSQNSKGAESVGRRFAAEREARGLSVAEVGAATHMMEKHVRAIETDDFAALGAPIYAKGFIKLYAEFLGFDAAEILNEIGRITFRKNERPVLTPPPSPRSDRTAELSDAVQEQVGKVVTAARNLPSHVSPELIRKVLTGGGVLLALVLLIAVVVVGVRSCAAVLKERPATTGQALPRSGAVIEEPAEPYLDTP